LLVIKKRREQGQFEDQRELELAARESLAQIAKQKTEKLKEPASPIEKLKSELISEEAGTFLKKSKTSPLK